MLTRILKFILLAGTFAAVFLTACGTGGQSADGDVTVKGFVWDDEDADGIRDANETGMIAVNVSLLWNKPDLQEPENLETIETVTDTQGNFSFNLDSESLTEGDSFTIEVEPPKDATFSVKDAGSDDTKDSDVTAGERGVGVTDSFKLQGSSDPRLWGAGLVFEPTGVGAGVGDAAQSLGEGVNKPPELEKISGFVWVEYDGDGVWQQGEERLAGLEVILTVDQPDGADPSTRNTTTQTTKTGADGAYSFDAKQIMAFGEGFFSLQFFPPSGGYDFTKQDAGDNEDIDSDVDDKGQTGGDIFAIALGNETDLIWSAGMITLYPPKLPVIAVEDPISDCGDMNNPALQTDCNGDVILFGVGLDAENGKLYQRWDMAKPIDPSAVEFCSAYSLDGNENTGTGQVLLNGIETLACYSGFDEVAYVTTYDGLGNFLGSVDLGLEQAQVNIIRDDENDKLATAIELLIDQGLIGEITADTYAMAYLIEPPTTLETSDLVPVLDSRD